jgi:hypothetical protein
MAQVYSNPKRANDPHALPNIETFYVGTQDDTPQCPQDEDAATHRDHIGWYWQARFPGCLPDGEPEGPFATEAEAIADAQSDEAAVVSGDEPECRECGGTDALSEPGDDGIAICAACGGNIERIEPAVADDCSRSYGPHHVHDGECGGGQ